MQSSQNSAVSIDPIQWANWLQSIAKNPQGHGKIARENNQYTYLSSEEIKRRRSIEVVNIQSIMDISSSLLQNREADTAQTYQMLQGLRYIHQRRESKYQNMFFLFRWFAKLGGIEAKLAKEKAIILSLEESVKSNLSKLGTLDQHRENLNEAIFEGAKNLHYLKQVVSTEDTDRQAEVEALKKKVYALNPRVPTIKSLIKAFGPEVIKSTLQETIEFIYAEKVAPEQRVSSEELARDQALFQCSELEAKAIYIKRLIKHQRTDLSVSFISAIERTWEELVQTGQQKAVAMNLSGHRVLFIPGKDGEKGEVFIHDRYLAKGTYKAAFVATEFFTGKKKELLDQYVVLLPAKLVEDEIPDDAADSFREADRWTRTEERKTGKKVRFEDSTSSSSQEEYSTLSSEEGTSDTRIIVDTQEIERREKLKKEGKGTEVEESTGTSDSYNSDSYSTVKINKAPDATSKTKESSQVVKNDAPKENTDASGTYSTSDFSKLPGAQELEKDEDYESLDFDNSPEINSIKANIQLNNTIIKPITKQSVERLATQPSEDEEDYRREAGYCVRLGNLPGIWPTHRVATVQGQIAIIQKKAGYRVEGLRRDAIDLDDMAHLAEQNRLSVRDQIAFLNMIEDFLLGVKSVHDQGLIHRDIKPKNILCGTDKAGVSDFGLVCPLTISNEKGESIPNPERYTFIGTPFYIAPEVTGVNSGVNGKPYAEVDQKADIWSVGISLWKMLTGKRMEEHPAIGCSHPMRSLFRVQALLIGPGLRKDYENKYPEPEDKTGIAHLIWSCTRIDSKERPDIQTVIQRYRAWKTDIESLLQKPKSSRAEIEAKLSA
ncbi:protein kinase domain-containing protein [Candidatus Protochlamydia phocaeensis]|uniref:protein kinase domain-containing protein n=1 Tax=Candidatus Protochlamydia phocaeensis TaxID=1414722 RepID=UPI0008396A02|nr:protein kinase [Candidatus Protochlamydia phocaeensis]